MKEDQEVVHGSAEKPNNSSTAKKKQKLKGPKITANITTTGGSSTAANLPQQEDGNYATDTQSLSIVTKLRSWEEFFDPEEL